MKPAEERETQRRNEIKAAIARTRAALKSGQQHDHHIADDLCPVCAERPAPRQQEPLGEAF